MAVDFLKSKVKVKLSLFSEKDGSLNLIKSKWEIMKKKDIRSSFDEEKDKNGEFPKHEIVYAEPKQFQFNVFYFLADGKKGWIFLKETEEDN